MRKTVLRLASCVLLPLAVVAEEATGPTASDFAATNVLTVLTPLTVTNVVTVVKTNVVTETIKDRRIEETTNLVTRTFTLHNIGAEDLAERFNKTWTGDFGAVWKIGKVAQAFPDANKVMVTAPRSVVEA